MKGDPKCLNRLLTAFWVGVFLLAYSGTVQAETTLDKLDKISIKLTEISKQYNELSVNSEITLMDLQERFPKLVIAVNELKEEANLLSSELELLTEKSDTLLGKWTSLKSGIDNLSSSVETLEMSLSILDDSVKRAEKRSNTGLIISIGAAILGILALGYSMFGESK